MLAHLKMREKGICLTHVHSHILHDVCSTCTINWCSELAKKSTVSKVAKAGEKLPAESHLGHLVGGRQAAAKGGGDGAGDGAGDRSLDLASECRNEEGTNDPENYDLSQCTGRQAKVFKKLSARKMSS